MNKRLRGHGEGGVASPFPSAPTTYGIMLCHTNTPQTATNFATHPSVRTVSSISQDHGRSA
eukprot:CAMPEP_0198119262 /NCGR_PEP_ID=MMETSP1442-20131203/24869_1 /TAXON_ID= /ORGANISM="Craspedostauros australis, Strain CCMP3328" /LENGTH=60 /DNA_ID=CAMNT_0043777685 /DNA_START=397 /DNA_END=576 /DNA_ORIENTATION=+